MPAVTEYKIHKGVFGRIAEFIRKHDAILPDFGQFVAEFVFDLLAVSVNFNPSLSR